MTEAHRVSVGGAIAAAEAVMRGEVTRAFSLVRPPGHHAMKMVHGIRGFCTVNVEAIMIAYLRRHYGVRRIAIVDTDVHHGDGTQDIFTTIRILYLSPSIKTGAPYIRVPGLCMNMVGLKRSVQP